MTEFTINYKDHAGRKNQTKFYGKDLEEATDKFKVLHPDCYITD